MNKKTFREWYFGFSPSDRAKKRAQLLLVLHVSEPTLSGYVLEKPVPQLVQEKIIEVAGEDLEFKIRPEFEGVKRKAG